MAMTSFSLESMEPLYIPLGTESRQGKHPDRTGVSQPGHSYHPYHVAMAEIRKYDPAEGNAIVEALRAAMGDPIRPVAPGERAAPKPKPEPEEPGTSWVSLRFADDAQPGSAED